LIEAEICRNLHESKRRIDRCGLLLLLLLLLKRQARGC
jgi:hypothetical protein